jgi:methyl-accepting chemotaxis protein
MWFYDLRPEQYSSNRLILQGVIDQPPRTRLSTWIGRWLIIAVILLATSTIAFPQQQSQPLTRKTVVSLAKNCAAEIESKVEQAEARGDLNVGTMFDRMYIPVPSTSPTQYRTSYDSWADEIISPILKSTLGKKPDLMYILLMDPNGYMPVTPAIREINQIPVPKEPRSISDTQLDLEAAKCVGPEIFRSVGSTSDGMIMEIVVPVILRNRPWGVIRVGYLDR